MAERASEPRDRIKELWRASKQRLEVANFLVAQTTFYHDGMYLAGYAVECALTVLILERTPESGRSARFETWMEAGAKAHNYDYLKEELEQASSPNRQMGSRPIAMPEEIKDNLRQVREWSSEWQYQVKHKTQRDAQPFLDAVTKLCSWVERSR